VRGRFSRIVVLLIAFGLSGCAGLFYSSPPEIAKRERFFNAGPPEVSLLTVTHKPTGIMWHSALLITADERVLYESGGYWKDPEDRRLVDVHYNMTDARLADYVERRSNPKSWEVTLHRVAVSDEVAMMAKQRAETNQMVLGGFCAQGVAMVLKELPGFEDIGPVFLPHDLVPHFEEIPGVQRELLSRPVGR
jgi:hypothetical protein